MLIVEKLSKEIASFSKSDKSVIVSICGAADLGKSYLSKSIADLLSQSNLRAGHLTMDSYLMDRKTRNKKGLSGYHIESYNLNLAINHLKELKNGHPVEIGTYDHKEGRRTIESTRLNPPEILIFDGLHSMHSPFLPYIDISVFVYTKDDDLKTIRREADLIKRNYTTEFSEKISDSEFKLYKTNVEPYKVKANYLLFLESKWNYKLIKSNHNNS